MTESAAKIAMSDNSAIRIAPTVMPRIGPKVTRSANSAVAAVRTGSAALAADIASP